MPAEPEGLDRYTSLAGEKDTVVEKVVEAAFGRLPVRVKDRERNDAILEGNQEDARA